MGTKRGMALVLLGGGGVCVFRKRRFCGSGHGGKRLRNGGGTVGRNETPKPFKTSLRREMKSSLSYVMCIVISPCVETKFEVIICESEMYFNVERGC